MDEEHKINNLWDSLKKVNCPKCNEVCNVLELEVTSDLFGNSGSCLNCLTDDQLLETLLVLEVKKELIKLSEQEIPPTLK